MKKNILMMMMIILGGLTFANAQIGEKPANGKPSVAEQQVNTLSLAYENARYGRETKSADALIVAARILRSIPVDKLTAEPKTSGGSPDSSKKTTTSDMTYESILADAKKLAGKDKVLLGQIAKIEKMSPPTRGATGGPKRGVYNIPANSTVTMEITFRGGEDAAIIASGDGDTDLDLFVYDSDGTLVRSDIDYTDQCTATFFVPSTRTITVKIVNHGSTYNHTVVVTN